jgi:DNA-binding transcriptional regulator LsrR (DeoR family)
LPPSLIERLVADGVVGDLLVHPLTERGTFPASALAGRAVAISIERLRAVPRVVAVAAGAAKARAIRGALRSGLVQILVTDVAAASAIVGSDDVAATGAHTRTARDQRGRGSAT